MKDTKLWDHLARHYNDKVFHLTKYPQVMDRIISLVKTGRILDMGCGPTGILLNALRWKGNEMVGLDVSSKMIAQTEKVFLGGNLVVSDMKETFFKDNSFDSVVSINSLLPEERSDIHLIMREVYRILKPSGRFVAYLPSFNYVIKAVSCGFDIELDYRDYRVWDNNMWQCFYMVSIIQDMLLIAGFTKWTIDMHTFNWKETLDDVQRLYDFDVSEVPIEEYVILAIK